MKHDQKRLWNYGGVVGNKHAVQMTLVFTGDAVTGEYFYLNQRTNIPLRGLVSNERLLTLEELDAGGKVAARFVADLKQECHVIAGAWQKTGSSSKLAVDLVLESGSPGTLGKRYAVAGADNDDLVHRNAVAFWVAVKKGDRKAVAALAVYPVKAQLKGKQVTLASAEELLEHYKAIFTPQYRAAILDTVPHNMNASWEGIMLGKKGEVWLNREGRPTAFNN